MPQNNEGRVRSANGFLRQSLFLSPKSYCKKTPVLKNILEDGSYASCCHLCLSICHHIDLCRYHMSAACLSSLAAYILLRFRQCSPCSVAILPATLPSAMQYLGSLTGNCRHSINPCPSAGIEIRMPLQALLRKSIHALFHPPGSL